MPDAIINSRNPYEIQEIEIEVELSGYFYLKTTGKFVSNIGTSQNCYAVREKKNMYVKSEVEAFFTNKVLQIGQQTVAKNPERLLDGIINPVQVESEE